MTSPATLQRNELDDQDYVEVNDDRPDLDPVERPNDERGERPMRGDAGGAPRAERQRPRSR